jgi:hypothetical protein
MAAGCIAERTLRRRRVFVGFVVSKVATIVTVRRKPLFTQYVKNPNDIRMALELKHIDDQIAECTERMEMKKGSRC